MYIYISIYIFICGEIPSGLIMQICVQSQAAPSLLLASSPRPTPELALALRYGDCLYPPVLFFEIKGVA